MGFDLCGVAAAEAFPELGFFTAVDRAWLCGHDGISAQVGRAAVRCAQRHGVCAFGHRDRRALQRRPAVSRPNATTRRGARWRDTRGAVTITRFLAERLEALLSWMTARHPEPFDARAYVDTGPVQERVYAQYAGLGWIGKNTCVINPELGSWLLLGAIICSLPLEPDSPAVDQCGTCTLCLEACPTGAFAGPHELDATRCVSYLTIEYRGSIPEEHRERIGNHLFGCDICQEVCPWNGAPSHTTDPSWSSRDDLNVQSLIDLWRRTDGELAASSATRR